MNKTVLVINGSGGVGKDTFCDLIKKHLSNTEVISSVDKVKEIAKLCGWNGSKEENDRKFLSDLKIITSNYNDFSYNYIKEKIALFNKNPYTKLLIIHIREPKEIQRVKEDFNATTCLINNNRIKQIITNEADANVHHYVYEYYIDNNGTIEDLENEAIEFINKLERRQNATN